MRRLGALPLLGALASAAPACTEDVMPPPGEEPRRFSLSGRVTYEGAGLAGVTVHLGGKASKMATTNAEGDYRFLAIESGDYELTPAKTNFVFMSEKHQVRIDGAAVSGKGFVASLVANPKYAISGVVSDTSGALLSGVAVRLSGAATAATITGAAGAYGFADLSPGVYTIAPRLLGYSMEPRSLDVSIDDADFTAVYLVLHTVLLLSYLEHSLDYEELDYGALANDLGEGLIARPGQYQYLDREGGAWPFSLIAGPFFHSSVRASSPSSWRECSSCRQGPGPGSTWRAASVDLARG